MTAPGAHHPTHPPLPYSMKKAMRVPPPDSIKRSIEKATTTRDANCKAVLHDAFGERLQDVRHLAKAIKRHTIAHIDQYIEQFIENAEAQGTQVHFALDGGQANDICLDIVRQNSLTRCVKSKSMVTEEIDLLPALAKAGVTAWETDLGEYIIQLDDDAPAHIVLPVIHKNRVDVGKLFERELKCEYSEDPEVLTRIARRTLRAEYEQADLGISGGNFLIAETGSVVICTNEGNADLAVALPRVHIAFVGIEKLIPKIEHLGVLLKLLARSATSQPITVYTTIVHGPRRPHEHDGPEQFHIILIDNGRTKLLNDESSELLQCIRCGACLNACPVFREVGGGHAYGAVYSGPIGAVLTPSLREGYADLPEASSLCGACVEACPVQIDIPHHLVRMRAQRAATKPLGERAMVRLWSRALQNERRYLRALKWLRRLGKPWLTKLPGPAKQWATGRTLPRPASQSFREWWLTREGGAR